MNTPIRVLHVIGIMNIGGAESMIMNLYRHIDRSKVQFDFVENSYEQAFFDEEIRSLGGRIYRCPHYNGKNHLEYVKWWKHFFKTHTKEKYIVHGHIGSTAAIYLRLAKKYRLYTIAHSHNAATTVSLRNVLYGLYSFPTRFIADHFFACSMAAGISRYGKRVASDERKCTILNNAIDTERYRFNQEKRNEVRKKNGWENKFVIGHVGRFDPIKNHAFLIEVFKSYYTKNKDAQLVLIGDGGERQAIAGLVHTNNLECAVSFMGFRKDIAELMQGIDVLTLPSLSEGLPVTIIEGQAAGLTCLCSNAVTREVDITGNCRFLKIDSVSDWVSELEKCRFSKREDTKNRVVEAGYDINTTAKWLENYYLGLDKG